MTRFLCLFSSLALVLTLAACGKPDFTHQQQPQAPQGRVIKGDATAIDELMAKSGANAQVSLLPAKIMRSADDQLRRGVIEVDKVRQILKETFNPADLRNTLRSHLIQNLNDEQVNKILDWLDSDLGKKITALEIAGAKPDAGAEAMSQYHQLSTNTARVAQVRELEELLDSSNHSVDLALSLRKSLQLALNQSLPEGKQISEAEFLAREEEARPGMLSRFKAFAEATYLYNYQTLSDEELDSYIAFAQSDTAKIYHHALSEGLQEAMARAGKVAGLKIAALNAG